MLAAAPGLAEVLTPPAPQTLLELLRQQARNHPDRVAFKFCPDGERERARLTYRELDTRARAVGAALQQRGAAGQRVLVFCHAGLDSLAAFFGCFYAGATVVPVDEHWASQRAAAVIPDARPAFALAPGKTLATLRARVAELTDIAALDWLPFDQPGADPDAWILPPLRPDATAVIQYTSGSTGSPKGVVLTHRNYLANLADILTAWQLTDRGTEQPVVGVSWLPHFHDMGFVGGVLAVVAVGGTLVLMSRGAVLMRPMQWLQAIDRHRATVSAAPHLGYQLCRDRSTAEQRAELDLSCWAVAVDGGDPIDPATMTGFIDAFAPAGFTPAAMLPAYGLAEATLAVSGGSDALTPTIAHLDRMALGADRVVDASPDQPRTVAITGCGRPGASQRVLIVDPDTREVCAPDGVGEIWVAGPNVAHGYFRRPAETERTFGARLAGGDDGPFLRTGDRGFLRGGELFVVGRCQDLITVDGTHHYPNDIETTVQDCAPILLAGRGAVFTVEAGYKVPDQLIIVQEVHRHHLHATELGSVIDAVREAVRTRHGVEPYAVLLVKPMRVPTTTSGKIQRGACRQRYLKRELEPVAQWQGPPPVRPPKKEVLARVLGSALTRHYLNRGRPDR